MSSFGKKFCERTRQAAVAVIRFSAQLPRNPAGWEIGKQVVRSSNSVAANLEEAQGAITGPDFLNKVNLARKEARETLMWLRNIRDSGLADGQALENLIGEYNEVVGILVASVKTLQNQSAKPAARRSSSTRDSRLATRDSRETR
ncbi:MAG TPA: four helix bundle protein [Phycisphaerales bacterium]|nr:four helix bundle protein [Phycisphaerales bacterium]